MLQQTDLPTLGIRDREQGTGSETAERLTGTLLAKSPRSTHDASLALPSTLTLALNPSPYLRSAAVPQPWVGGARVQCIQDVDVALSLLTLTL